MTNQNPKDKPEAQSGVEFSAGLGVTDLNENGNDRSMSQKSSDESQKDSAYNRLPLTELLAMTRCSPGLVGRLVGNNHQQLQCLFDLWIKLGHPKDGLWQALFFDVRKIDYSCASLVTPNDPSSD